MWRPVSKVYPEITISEYKNVRGELVELNPLKPDQAAILHAFPSEFQWRVRLYDYKTHAVVFEAADMAETPEHAKADALLVVGDEMLAYAKTAEEIAQDQSDIVAAKLALASSREMTVEEAVAAGVIAP